MTIAVSCAACGATFNVADQHAGKRAKCKECGEPLQIPAAPEEAPSAEEERARPRVERRSSRGRSAGGAARRRRAEREEIPDGLSPAAVAAGVGGAVAGALLWYLIGKTTGREIGWIALGVGALIGFLMNALRARGVVACAVGTVLVLAAIMGGKFVLYAALRTEVVEQLVSVDQLREEFLFERELGAALAASDDKPTLEDVRAILTDLGADGSLYSNAELNELRSDTAKYAGLADVRFKDWLDDARSEIADEISPLEMLKETLEPLDLLFLVLGVGAVIGQLRSN